MQQKNEEDDKENRERKIACYFNNLEKLIDTLQITCIYMYMS